MTPNDDSLHTASPAVALRDEPHFAADLFQPDETMPDATPDDAVSQTDDGGAPLDAVKAQAVAEFEALVDEIAAELEAVWDDDDGLDAGAGGGDGSFGGAADSDDGSRTSKIRAYARELVAAAYLNRDNSAWDPTVAQSYCNAEADDALLPMLIEASSEEEDGAASDATQSIGGYLPDDPEDALDSELEGHALASEDGTQDAPNPGGDMSAAQPVLMRCHV